MFLLSAQNLRVSAVNQGRKGKGANASGPLPLLQNVTINVRKNKLTCLIGESGAGKSIFSKAITDLLPENVYIDQGEIIYKGQAVAYNMLKKMRGRGIFYAPQNAAASLNPMIKIKQQLTEVSIFHLDQIIAILKDLDIMDPDRILNSYPFQLSGGENQRCLLAMAVALQPELLILDEPTSALDFHLQEKFITTIKKIQQYFGLAVFLITHNLSFVRYTDYVYIIFKGEIIEEGDPMNLLSTPKTGYTKKLLDLAAF